MAQRQGGMQLESLSPQQLQVRARSARDLADRLKRRRRGASLRAPLDRRSRSRPRGRHAARVEPSRRARGRV